MALLAWIPVYLYVQWFEADAANGISLQHGCEISKRPHEEQTDSAPNRSGNVLYLQADMKLDYLFFNRPVCRAV